MSRRKCAIPVGIQVTFLDQTGDQVSRGGHRLQRTREPDYPQHHHQDEPARDQSRRAADELLPRS